jgi:hypothetical protein
MICKMPRGSGVNIQDLTEIYELFYNGIFREPGSHSGGMRLGCGPWLTRGDAAAQACQSAC